MRKRSIRKRWDVVGIYSFSRETSSWVYECEYSGEKTVWEFGRHYVTCYHSGKKGYTVPYMVFKPNRMLIDHWKAEKHFNSHSEAYFLEKQGKDLYLCEVDKNTPEGTWQAIKLVKAK